MSPERTDTLRRSNDGSLKGNGSEIEKNGLAGRAFEAARDRDGNAAGDASGLAEGVQNVRGGGAVSDVVLDPDTRGLRVFFHGTADDITAFDLNHANRKDVGIQGGGSQQGIHGNAGCDRWLPAHGYQHSYQKKRTLRPRGSPRAWAECGADASQHHPRPSAATEAARQAQMLPAHRSPLLRPIRKRERHPGRYKTTGCNGPKLGRPHNGVPRMTG